MSQKIKRDQQPSSFLTPDNASTFHHETESSLETIKRALADLELAEGPLKHKILLTPVSDGYDFRYEVARPGGMGSGLSAYALGHLWQNEHGQSVVDGTIHISLSDNQFLGLTVVSVIIPPFLLLWLPALMLIATQRGDTRRIRDNIAQAVKKTESHSSVAAAPIGFQA